MMDLIVKQRGAGKTCDLIRMSAITRTPILANNTFYVKWKARELGLDIPEPISWHDWEKAKGREVYIDELEWFLKSVMGLKVMASTLTSKDICG